MMPVFMTVDTEGDDLWSWHEGRSITTENAGYIPPFQELCERCGIVPVYLVNYEMAMSDAFVAYIKPKADIGRCEIGMHLHAWNSPPEVPLEVKYAGNPYITEYSKQAIREKHVFLKHLITERFGIAPVTYRSGRWATNEDLFDVLEELGFLIDCSVTPGIRHNAPGGTVPCSNHYAMTQNRPYALRKRLWEVPMTTDVKRSLRGNSLKRRVVHLLRGEQRWLRPALHSVEEMMRMTHDLLKKEAPYLMFMIHSSELMPGGSPYCKTEEDVDAYLCKLEDVFQSLKGVAEGSSLKDYYSQICEEQA